MGGRLWHVVRWLPFNCLRHETKIRRKQEKECCTMNFMSLDYKVFFECTIAIIDIFFFLLSACSFLKNSLFKFSSFNFKYIIIRLDF